MEIPKDKRFENLTGRTFGRLLVLEYAGCQNQTTSKKGITSKRHLWLCQCICGNKKVIGSSHLKRGDTQSCGCLQKEKTQEMMVDLANKKFGRLTVLEYYGALTPGRKKGKNHQWRCRCECGNEAIILGMCLRSGTTQSCGCLQKDRVHESKFIDLTGKQFGRLEVIKFVERRCNQSHWLCKCACGKEKIIAGNSLKAGRSRSCGAKHTNYGQGNYKHGLSGKPGYKKFLRSDPVRKLRHYIGIAVKDALKKRNSSKNGQSVFKYLPYTSSELKVHLESLFEPWMSWENYGGCQTDPRKTWWIDHIIPQSRFNFKTLDDPLFLECWSLPNLRPLEKMANIKKGCR